MSGFVVNPNLPHNAEQIIIGDKYAGLLSKSLENQHIHPVFMPDNPNIDLRLSGHADLSALHTGGEGIYLAPYLRNSAFADNLESLGCNISFPDITQRSQYPHDAQMNVCIAGESLFYNPKSVPQLLINYLTINRGLNGIQSRQGYTRCSVCVVSDNAVITADPGLRRVAINHGFDALLISPGHIELSGFDYGFIGGSTFKISNTRLAFTGRLDQHPDKARILCFLEQHSVEPVYITNEPLFDIGSAIPIVEG